MRKFVLLTLALMISVANAALSHAGGRIALVIGNSTYENVAKLPNPVNDAGSISEALKRLGFDVTLARNLNSGDMRKVLRDFGHRASGADMAVVYYAGHGIEIGGTNYLIPVDARLRTDLDAYYEAIPLDLVLAAIKDAKGLRMILLDACRNNPFASTMKVTSAKRSIGRGLARIEPDTGILVSYAAKEGTTAADGDTGHSPYTDAVLKYIEEPGVDVQFMFRKVRDLVVKQTNGQQEPFTYGSLPGKRIYLKNAPALAPVVVAKRTTSDETNVEIAYWNSIKDSKDEELYKSYISQFPEGRFVNLARLLIQRIEHKKAPDASEPAPDVPTLVSPSDASPSGETAPVASAPASDETPIDGNNAPGVAADNGDGDGTGKNTVVASAPPPAVDEGPEEAPALPVMKRGELVRAIQSHLNRIGCNAGRPDGQWGRGSKRAARQFKRYSKVRIASLSPNAELLDILKNAPGRVCPLQCGRGRKASHGRCIVITCRRGQVLSRGGVCVKVHPPVERVRTKGPLRKRIRILTRRRKQTPRPSRRQCGRCAKPGHNLPGEAASLPNGLNPIYCGAKYLRYKALGRCG